MFNEDIILDEAAFDKAVKDFDGLTTRLGDLSDRIDDMLELIATGLDTPAGRKFISSCQENLKKPMKDMKVVLGHIATSLKEAKTSYAVVFTEYDELNKMIDQVND